MNYILGDYVGFNESIYTEFKEFSLKFDPIKYLEIESIKEIIETGVLSEEFNDIILINIDHYFKYYLPKYISAFGNIKPDEDNDKEILPKYASFYIGINDFGEVTGIPFIGEMDQDHIREIFDSIKIFINTNNNNDLFSNIHIELIELEKNINYLDDPIDKFILQHTEKYNQSKKIYIEYIKNHLEWISLIEKYTIKMTFYLNDTEYRNKLAEYIRSKTTQKEYLFIADQLNGTHKFKILNGLEIIEQKNNPFNVYHWLTNYKDDTIECIKQIRPVRPHLSQKNFDEIYEYQFIKLTNLRKRFIQYNKDIKYYIIKINIPINYKENISYCNVGNKRWIIKIRDVINGRPCCI